MNIDFYTLIAQIINLLILLFLLRKFLYIPVLKAVEEKQRQSEEVQKQIAMQKQKADLLEKQILQKVEEFDIQKQIMLKKAKQQADDLSQQLEQRAHEHYREEISKWKNILISDQQNFEHEVQNLVAEYFKDFTKSALEQLANENLNDLVLQKFKAKILHLSDKKRVEILEPFRQKQLLEIITADRLSAEQKAGFSNFLHQEIQIPDTIKIVYSVDKKIICGIVMKAQDLIIEWNLAEYLANFNKKLHSEVTNLISRG